MCSRELVSSSEEIACKIGVDEGEEMREGGSGKGEAEGDGMEGEELSGG